MLVQRSPWQIMCDSVAALFLREVKTRFGSNRLGYFWALFDPFAQAAFMALIFTLIGRESVAGVPVALFLITGILPFKLFSKLLPQLSAAVSANKALFGYRQVQPITPIITRFIIEIVTFFVVYILTLLALIWIGMDAVPHQLLELLGATALLAVLALSIGLILCSATEHWQDTPKLVGIVMMPMFFISGIFYCATMIPSQYWFLFSWNPIFHLIELSRDAFFESYTTPIGSWTYVASVALVLLAGGLMLYRLNRQRFIAG